MAAVIHFPNRLILGAIPLHPKFSLKFGEFGKENGQFNLPFGVAVDANRIIVADGGNNRIQIFSDTGQFITSFGSHGSGPGQFNIPSSVAVDNDGRIIVCDYSNHRIQVFSNSGQFLFTFGSTLDTPSTVAVDCDDRIIVGDQQGIHIFSYKGQFISTIKLQNHYYSNICAIVVSDDKIIVVLSHKHEIQILSKTGEFISKFGRAGIKPGEFYYPANVAVDKNGNILVTELTPQVQIFTQTGNFISSFGTSGKGDGQFTDKGYIAVDSNGRVILSDVYNHRIQIFS